MLYIAEFRNINVADKETCLKMSFASVCVLFINVSCALSNRTFQAKFSEALAALRPLRPALIQRLANSSYDSLIRFVASSSSIGSIYKI